ncbi:MAG TPA: hypothetical protein VNZ52_06660 [Candidatus Thermoplasmatota archaeon]|nr:hypothetical protein [Candidatus Thermoplasmatota archaeon]
MRPIRDRWAEEQGLDPRRRGTSPPPPGGVFPDDQAAVATYGGGIPALPGLMEFAEQLSFPASTEQLKVQAGDRPVYIVNNFVVPLGKLLDKLPRHQFASVAEFKEVVAQEWPSISPRP